MVQQQNMVAPATRGWAEMLKSFLSNILEVHRVEVRRVSVSGEVKRRSLEDVIANPPRFPDLREPKVRRQELAQRTMSAAAR